MVKIRLFRTGTTKRPLYRIVAMDSRRARQARFIESLGTYDPRGGGAATLRREAIEEWVGKGAQLSDTVRSLLRRDRDAARAAAVETPDPLAPAAPAPETPAPEAPAAEETEPEAAPAES